MARVAWAVFISVRAAACNEPRSALTMWLDACARRAAATIRQTILVVHGESVRSRLLSPREAARLMGLPEELPSAVELQRGVSPRWRWSGSAGGDALGAAHPHAYRESERQTDRRGRRLK